MARQNQSERSTTSRLVYLLFVGVPQQLYVKSHSCYRLAVWWHMCKDIVLLHPSPWAIVYGRYAVVVSVLSSEELYRATRHFGNYMPLG